MNLPEEIPAADAPDDAWQAWRELWQIRPDTTYLNHGSFGPPPRPVVEKQCEWQQALRAQPMDFFVRQMEPAWFAARDALARFVDTAPENLAFIENCTAGMNLVAESFPLKGGDEVLLTDHEYGAVVRIWQRRCAELDAAEPMVATLPRVIESAEQVVDAIFQQATAKTRLLVVSHITSPTAITLPVEAICAEARRRGIAVCIDGPHAPAQVPLSLDKLGCDFYVASLHKWLCAPFGSGFCYVAPEWQSQIRHPQMSWGRLAPAEPKVWWEELLWPGTRDPSSYLTVPTAIELLEQVGLERFRERCHHLARYARERMVELTGQTPRTPDSPEWYTAMASVPLPPGDRGALQTALWERHRIETPVVECAGVRSIRVSCHLYNTHEQIDRFIAALGEELRREEH